MSKATIGITMGDAAGIGPEIIVKALADHSIYEACKPVVIGDRRALAEMAEIVKADVRIRPIQSLGQAKFEPGLVDCLDLDLLGPGVTFGELSARAGDAAYCYLVEAVALAKAGSVDAICTAPLNKKALRLGGHDYPGHTEILAELSGSQDFAMMFVSPRLKVLLVTIHVGLIEAIRIIDPDRVYRTIAFANSALEQMGCDRPRIAVCGINPHAGEDGLFGRHEEEERIAPAIDRAVRGGLEVSGPYPADTIFYRALRGEFDVVVAMYHDQGLIPVKTLGIDSAVNITLGLPFIRTSVDHGTAFDIAGKGIADETNMRTAILQAATMVNATRHGERTQS
jgi:4-phospho-D-threonate 3-dehydrogenase / 4-phospho-D-erythronate 3-dehydrogenase